MTRVLAKSTGRSPKVPWRHYRVHINITSDLYTGVYRRLSSLQMADYLEERLTLLNSSVRAARRIARAELKGLKRLKANARAWRAIPKWRNFLKRVV